MPWSASDAKSKTKKASSPTKQRQWAHVANSVLEKTGDEGRAIREANRVVARNRGGRAKSKQRGAAARKGNADFAARVGRP